MIEYLLSNHDVVNSLGILGFAPSWPNYPAIFTVPLFGVLFFTIRWKTRTARRKTIGWLPLYCLAAGPLVSLAFGAMHVFVLPPENRLLPNHVVLALISVLGFSAGAMMAVIVGVIVTPTHPREHD